MDGKYFFKIGTNGYLNNLTPFDEYIIVWLFRITPT